MIAQLLPFHAQLPTVLALLGTALMALAIFAPPSAAALDPAVSFAPPLAAMPVDRAAPVERSVPPERSALSEWSDLDPAPAFVLLEPFVPPAESVVPPPGGAESDERIGLVPAWPALVDPRADGCDAAVRLALVDALISVRAPWADALLCRAAAEEPDPAVSAALAAASYFAGTP